MAEIQKIDGLALLRQPFPLHQISKLPKPTKAQTDEVKADYTKGIRCTVCGAWHHPKVVHLDYVGHAALTDRLLDTDPAWYWEPLSFDSSGLPVLDKDGGLWIRLSVCGVTRLGYGDAQGKSGGDAMKERIGDALRNAAMRFGAALDLWHKGDLHVEDDNSPKADAKEMPKQKQVTPKIEATPEVIEPFDYDAASDKMCAATNEAELKSAFSVAWKRAKADKDDGMADTIKAIYDEQKAKLEVTQ